MVANYLNGRENKFLNCYQRTLQSMFSIQYFIDTVEKKEMNVPDSSLQLQKIISAELKGCDFFFFFLTRLLPFGTWIFLGDEKWVKASSSLSKETHDMPSSRRHLLNEIKPIIKIPLPFFWISAVQTLENYSLTK